MALEVKKRYPTLRIKHASHTLPQRTFKKEQRKLSLRRLLSTTLVLCIVTIAGGIGYTWYMGAQKATHADQAAVKPMKRLVIKPLKIASTAPIGVATQMVSSPVKSGDNASITVKTNPAADCSISVTYNDIPAHDSGLIAKPADEFGLASWSWTVAPSAPKGTWPVWVTCKNKKNTAVVKADLGIQ